MLTDDLSDRTDFSGATFSDIYHNFYENTYSDHFIRKFTSRKVSYAYKA